MRIKFLKPLEKEIGWLFLSKALADLKGDADLMTLYRRAEVLGRLGFMLVRFRRKLLLSNLRIALPEASKSDINRIAKKTVRHISRGFIDILYHAYHPELLPNHVRLEENGVIEDVLSTGRGCIVATGHVGTFPWIGVPIVARGAPFGPIARDPHDQRLKEVFDDARIRIGYTNIPDRPPMKVLKETRKVLKMGGAVMITFDMHPAGSSSLGIDFLGRKTPFFSFVIRLAAKTGVPLVPSHVLLEPDGLNHRVTFHHPIDVPPEAYEEDCPLTKDILQKLADWLSGIIRSHPEQWWGLYRRWRESDASDLDMGSGLTK